MKHISFESTDAKKILVYTNNGRAVMYPTKPDMQLLQINKKWQ